MLKHIKDIRSPIAVAQQKQAARKASVSEVSIAKSPPLTGASVSSHGHSQQASQSRPPLHVDSRVTGIAPGIPTAGANGQSGWPDIMSPAVESKSGPEDQSHAANAATSSSAEGSDGSRTIREVTDTAQSDGVSYAVAIYPYMAEQDDEFDVVV